MVKIVGKDESAVKRTTCKNCASRLEYTLQEVRQSYDSDYTGSRDIYYYIRCPGCNEEARVKSKW